MYHSTRCLVVAALGLSASALTIPVRRDVSEDVLAQLNLFEQYSATAYCPSDYDADVGATVTCASGNCPLVEQAGATALYSFDDAGSGDTTGLIAKDDTNKLIVLAFRGSKSISNWIANLEFGKTDASATCDGCETHDGFTKAWKSVSANVTAQIQDALSANPDYKIIATGHSLGGALATLAAVDLRLGGTEVDLYTYGCPRVGNTEFATFLTSQSGGTNYRVTHTDDPVPKLPPLSFGYSQPSPEYWITADTNATVAASDITVVQGIDSDQGNDGTPTGLDVDAHLWYFGPISGCD